MSGPLRIVQAGQAECRCCHCCYGNEWLLADAAGEESNLAGFFPLFFLPMAIFVLESDG